MPIKPLFSDWHLFYLNLYPCSFGRLHKTDLTVINNRIYSQTCLCGHLY